MPPVAYQEEEAIRLKVYLRIIRRYAWVILTFFTIVVVTTLVWSFTQRPFYTSTVTIKIERAEPRVTQYQPVVGEEFR